MCARVCVCVCVCVFRSFGFEPPDPFHCALHSVCPPNRPAWGCYREELSITAVEVGMKGEGEQSAEKEEQEGEEAE